MLIAVASDKNRMDASPVISSMVADDVKIWKGVEGNEDDNQAHTRVIRRPIFFSLARTWFSLGSPPEG